MAGRRKILSVVGTRPNFMKMAPIMHALGARAEEFEPRLVHTGQHYDSAMSHVFLDELGLGEPDYQLDVGSGAHRHQVSRVIERLGPVLDAEQPDIVLVPGDVNSTVAAAIAAAQREIPVGHVESGLRSRDLAMPEEVNRILTDWISDVLFTHSPEAERYLADESCPGAVHYVGNTMIDTLVALRPRMEADRALARHGLEPGSYVLVTLHRPALVDGPTLVPVMAELEALAHTMPAIFPVHPRTRTALEAMPRPVRAKGLQLVDPLGYLEFLSLLSGAAAVLTDSGGVQEEATFLGVPCLTLRDNTERPITISMGTNLLLGLEPGAIADLPRLVEEIHARPSKLPPLWDGKAAGRIVDVLAAFGDPAIEPVLAA